MTLAAAFSTLSPSLSDASPLRALSFSLLSLSFLLLLSYLPFVPSSIVFPRSNQLLNQQRSYGGVTMSVTRRV